MNLRISKKNLSTQVKEILLERIIRGEFAEGIPLPTEEQLGKTLGVSRITVRDAMIGLEQDGYLKRAAGRGTFVNEATRKLNSRISNSYNLANLIILNGFGVTEKVVEEKKISSKPFINKAFEAPGLKDVFVLKSLFLGDHKAAIFCENYFRADYFTESVFNLNKSSVPFYIFLENTYEFVQDPYDIVSIFPVIVDDDLSGIFKKKKGSPLLLIESVIYNRQEVPLVYSREYYNTEMIHFKEIRLDKHVSGAFKQ